MRKISVLSVFMALIMVFSLTTPAMAATKPETKTFKVSAGISYVDEDADSNVTFKVTNVTSSKTKDFSVDLVYDGEFTSTQ